MQTRLDRCTSLMVPNRPLTFQTTLSIDWLKTSCETLTQRAPLRVPILRQSASLLLT